MKSTIVAVAGLAMVSKAQQPCDYYGCTSNSACSEYPPASNVCGANGYCDFQWGSSGKCVYRSATVEANATLEAKVEEATQPCSYYGCTSDSACWEYPPASNVCGANGYCDFQFGSSGKCVYRSATVEAKATLEAKVEEATQPCSYYGCT